VPSVTDCRYCYISIYHNVQSKHPIIPSISSQYTLSPTAATAIPVYSTMHSRNTPLFQVSPPSTLYRLLSLPLRGGAATSLARLTSRCRRTESIVSLERGVCSYTEFQAFSCCRGWKEVCQATRAISTTSRRELSSIFFFPARQGAEGNSHHSDRNVMGMCTIVCHRRKLGGPI